MPASPHHAPTQIRTGDLVVDLVAKSAMVAGDPLRLKAKEWPLIEILSRRKDTVLTREMLLDHIYPPPDQPEIEIIDIFMHRLRGRMAHSTARIVETSAGDVMGFRLIGPPAPSQRGAAPGGPQQSGVRDD